MFEPCVLVECRVRVMRGQHDECVAAGGDVDDRKEDCRYDQKTNGDWRKPSERIRPGEVVAEVRLVNLRSVSHRTGW